MSHTKNYLATQLFYKTTIKFYANWYKMAYWQKWMSFIAVLSGADN
ncbi:MAG TPA: hypothetical protein VK890_07290 [Bacteroidia bacterium]|jgi:hypothetical protein|nr:hypothetical protein [Bacteroidia bacterium]